MGNETQCTTINIRWIFQLSRSEQIDYLNHKDRIQQIEMLTITLSHTQSPIESVVSDDMLTQRRVDDN